MGRNSSKKRRREANRRLPTFGSVPSLSKSRRDLYPHLASLLSQATQSRVYEPSTKLSTYFKSVGATTVTGAASQTQKAQKSKAYKQPNWSAVSSKKIEQPEADICRSRRERREVMFATNRAGRAGQKSPVWTEQSRKKCK